MKRKFWLFVLSIILGLSLPPLALANHPHHLYATPLASAATTAPTQGTMRGNESSETPVRWTLRNGTLTLTGGTLRYYLPTYQTPITNGILLDDLAKSAQDSPLDTNYDELYSYFQDHIQKVQLTGELTLKPGINNPTIVASYFFAHLTNVTTFSGLDYLDVSAATDALIVTYLGGLSYMFAYDTSLKTLTVPKLTDANPHTMQNMFLGDTALINLDLSHLDNSHVSAYYTMLNQDANLKILNLGNWSSPAKTGQIFTGATGLQEITLSKNMILKPYPLLLRSDLSINATPATDFTGNWQAVGDGTVNFIHNDPLQGYQNYDPQGDVLSMDDLYSRYSGDQTLTGNATYVWEPTDSYRFTAPAPVTPTTPTTPDTPVTEPDTAKFQSFSVSAIKKIGLYSHKTFTAANRLAWFARKPQMKQPTFAVIGTATSKAGNARYQVRDTNRHSATYGQTGYITANSAYVAHTYIESAPPAVTVINPGGINGYDTAALSRPQTHYKQGTPLVVKQVVTQGATTRFLLRNGHYISANQHLVTAGNQAIPTKVRAKTALNRYDTANLTRRNHHSAKKSHHVFKVLGWDYSHGNSTTTTGTLRYRVAGGYISANHMLVAPLP